MSILGVVLIVLFLLRLFVGSSGFGFPSDDLGSSILNLRAVAAVSACVVGICLAVSGVYLQTLLRNPLASPYILGLAAGAGLGVAIFQFLNRVMGTNTILAAWPEQIAALVGALSALAIVFILGRHKRSNTTASGGDPLSLLLYGVMISAICGAAMMLLQFLSPAQDTDHMIRWMMGRISQLSSWYTLCIVGVVSLAGTILGVYLSPSLNALYLSDDEATTVGINIKRVRFLLFVSAGIMTAAAVVLAGPLGFIGLLAPHIARSIVGHHHRCLILAAACVGGGLVIGSDVAVQILPQTHGLIPIGVLTAAIGGPFFIYLLHRRT